MLMRKSPIPCVHSPSPLGIMRRFPPGGWPRLGRAPAVALTVVHGRGRVRACGHLTAQVVVQPHVTGNYDYLLQVEVADLPAYEDFHAHQLASLPGVATVT